MLARSSSRSLVARGRSGVPGVVLLSDDSRQRWRVHDPWRPHKGLQRGEIPALGTEAFVEHTFRLVDTQRFAALNGDDNPIHIDAAAARERAGVDRPIVQGMLSASLFATIFGRTTPGAVYVAQELRWRAPLLVDEPIRASIRVVRVRKRFIDCETRCVRTRDDSVVVDGLATVLLPSKDA
ncbi:hypothetical protein PINS_up007004 [Pythium insidiosum]|nr:hypothetical protein PINS_up007004 [Pythium insidiosum]